MSRFTTCGSWEGHYILDFLQEVQGDTGGREPAKRLGGTRPTHGDGDISGR
jgi:hypothetical protein